MDKNFIKETLGYHAQPVPGKLGVMLTKPCAIRAELALAYTAGAADAWGRNYLSGNEEQI